MAAKKPSSPGKPSKKAVTRTRSTTSSTTGKTAAGIDRTPSATATADEESRTVDPAVNPLFKPGLRLLTESEREAYLQLLARGASPAAACLQLGLSLTAVARTIEEEEGFRGLLDRLNELLSQNVAAALYRSAMEGSVTAQQFYLKNRPPPEWPQQTPDSSPAVDELTDDELVAQVRENEALLSALFPTTPDGPQGQRKT